MDMYFLQGDQNSRRKPIIVSTPVQQWSFSLCFIHVKQDKVYNGPQGILLNEK